MKVLSQVDAVVLAVSEVVVGFDNSRPILEVMSSEQRTQVVRKVTDMMAEGTAELSEKARAKFDSDKLLHGYAGSLCSCWFARSIKLNGGTKYEPKNPGSRSHSKDPELAQLFNLKKLVTDVETLKSIDENIAKRQLELKPEVTIDTSLISADLLEQLIKAGVKVA